MKTNFIEYSDTETKNFELTIKKHNWEEHNLIKDLIVSLIYYVDEHITSFDNKFIWNHDEEAQFHLGEIFGNYGFLICFLFNNIERIEEAITQFNIQHKTEYKIKIDRVLQEKNSFLGFFPHIEHNFFETKNNDLNHKVYDYMLYSIIKIILSDKKFSFQNKTIDLEPLYYFWYNYVNKINF